MPSVMNVMSQGKVLVVLRKENQFAVRLNESLPRLAFLLTKDSGIVVVSCSSSGQLC